MAQFSLEVTSDHAVPIPAGATVTNSSGDTLYYADYPGLTPGTNVGSIAAGSSITFATEFWVRSASLSTVLVVSPSVGDSLTYSGTPTSGQFLTLSAGTSGLPDTTLNPLVKTNRTLSLLSAAVSGDAAEQAAGGVDEVTGTASNQIQTVGRTGIAVNLGSAKGASLSPDACGIYGVGRVLGSGVGVGMGAFFRGESASSTGSISALQLQVYNNRGSDDSVNTTSFPSSSGIWLWADGPNRSSQGFTLANPFGRQMDVGLVFSGQTGATRTDANAATNSTTTVTDAAVLATDVGRLVTGTGIPANTVITSVTPGTSFTISNAATATNNPVSLTLAQVGPTRTADIQSSSTASTGILISGTHSTAAMSVAAGSGPVIVGGTTANQAALLEVQSTVAKRPLFSVGHSTAAGALSMFIVNTAGTSEYFISNSTDGVLTGTVAGDGGVRVVTSAKFFHIGGTTSTIKVGQANTLGFFNATAVAKQTSAGNTHTVAAGATTAVFTNTTFDGSSGSTAYTVGDIVLALKNYGLLTV